CAYRDRVRGLGGAPATRSLAGAAARSLLPDQTGGHPIAQTNHRNRTEGVRRAGNSPAIRSPRAFAPRGCTRPFLSFDRQTKPPNSDSRAPGQDQRASQYLSAGARVRGGSADDHSRPAGLDPPRPAQTGSLSGMAESARGMSTAFFPNPA